MWLCMLSCMLADKRVTVPVLADCRSPQQGSMMAVLLTKQRGNRFLKRLQRGAV